MGAHEARVRRLADRVKVIVAQTLETRVKDPRLGFVTVTDARVTNDMREATVFYTVLGSPEELAETAAALESAKGILRTEVGRQTGVRHTPSLTFIADGVPENARHIDDLLALAAATDAAVAAVRVGAEYAGEPDPYKAPREDEGESTRISGIRIPAPQQEPAPELTESSTASPVHATPSSAGTAPAPTAIEGIVVVDKPAGWTSHDVVSRMRRIAGTRRVGHAGTLDPMATGVLVVGIGRATRLLGHISGADKTYTATIRLGWATVTDDAEGERLGGAPADALTADDLAPVIATLTGPIMQRPSSVSAIKVEGRRSHDRVRAGEDVELAERPVVVGAFDVLDVRPVPSTGSPRSRRRGHLLLRDVHPGPGPRPRCGARRRGPPDCPATHPRGVLRAGPGTHPRAAGRGTRGVRHGHRGPGRVPVGDADSRRRQRRAPRPHDRAGHGLGTGDTAGVPRRRPWSIRTGRPWRPPTRTPRTGPTRTPPPHALFAADGEFLALARPRPDDTAEYLAVFSQP